MFGRNHYHRDISFVTFCRSLFYYCTHIIHSYIYETNIGTDMPSYKDYKYGVEYMFISLLAKSKFRTKVKECKMLVW